MIKITRFTVAALLAVQLISCFCRVSALMQFSRDSVKDRVTLPDGTVLGLTLSCTLDVGRSDVTCERYVVDKPKEPADGPGYTVLLNVSFVIVDNETGKLAHVQRAGAHAPAGEECKASSSSESENPDFYRCRLYHTTVVYDKETRCVVSRLSRVNKFS